MLVQNWKWTPCLKKYRGLNLLSFCNKRLLTIIFLPPNLELLKNISQDLAKTCINLIKISLYVWAVEYCTDNKTSRLFQNLLSIIIKFMLWNHLLVRFLFWFWFFLTSLRYAYYTNEDGGVSIINKNVTPSSQQDKNVFRLELFALAHTICKLKLLLFINNITCNAILIPANTPRATNIQLQNTDACFSCSPLKVKV